MSWYSIYSFVWSFSLVKYLLCVRTLLFKSLSRRILKTEVNLDSNYDNDFENLIVCRLKH